MSVRHLLRHWLDVELVVFRVNSTVRAEIDGHGPLCGKISTDGQPWAVYARLSKAAIGDLETVDQIGLCHQYAVSRALGVSEEHIYRGDSPSAWKPVRRPQWDALMAAVITAEGGEHCDVLASVGPPGSSTRLGRWAVNRVNPV